MTLPPEPTPAPSSAPIRLRQRQDYQLLAELGRGGMGVVYKARQVNLDRVVALKMVLSGDYASAQERGRFHTEAVAVAQLQHPNIVQVYEVGEDDGRPFLSLEYVAGGTLAEKLHGQPLSSRAAAELVRPLALAIHQAHTLGIVHRDLKPANVLLTPEGQPKITDFGLAKRLPGTSGGTPAQKGNTVSGQILGTPAYMAPEQADGRWREIGPGTDVYALGAILYECLTGRPPFVAATPLDTILHVLSDQPVPPRLLNSAVDEDLQTICLKCLEKDPRQRYPSALELADDLGRYLSGNDIHARSLNLLSRLTRMLEDHDHSAEFRVWGDKLFGLAAVLFIGHLLTWLCIVAEQPRWMDVATKVGQFVVGAGIFLRYRGQAIWPTTAAERQLWSVWIAYFLAYLTDVAVVWLLIQNEVIGPGAAGVERWRDLLVYPGSALLSGMAFFVMGSNFWNRYYFIGSAFFVLAMVMALLPGLSPLLFGTAWGLALAFVGWHLKKMAAPAS